MSEGGWGIRHVDVSRRRDPLGVEPADGPVFVVFWWGALPLGAKTFLPGELPIGRGRVLSLAAQMIPPQLAARCPELGAPVTAGTDGVPRPRYPMAAVRLEDIAEKLDAFAAPSGRSAEALSLIVCTRDRPDMLARCLAGLRALRHPPGELIVVDNSADGSAAAVCRAAGNLTYIHEPRPGLSVARNTGVRASTKPFVAFTDDDVEPHPNWTAEILAPFDDERIESVTGLVLPKQLDTPAMAFFQLEMGGLGANTVPIDFGPEFFAASLPREVHVWRVGAGANMAFRRSVFEKAGLFDERLGAGASGCSEDSEFWYRILAGGGTCRYEPKAIVFHEHRATWKDLRHQMRAYTRGHVSALVAQYDRFGHRSNLRRIFRRLPAHYVDVAYKTVKKGLPLRRLQILAVELIGWFAGLTYLLRPRWRRTPLPRL